MDKKENRLIIHKAYAELFTITYQTVDDGIEVLDQDGTVWLSQN